MPTDNSFPQCQHVVMQQCYTMEQDTAPELVSTSDIYSQAAVSGSAVVVQSISLRETAPPTETTTTAASPHGPHRRNWGRARRRNRNRSQGHPTSQALSYVGANDWPMHYRSVSPVSSLPVLNPTISYGARDSTTELLEINRLSLADSSFVNNYIDSPRRMMERINNNDPSVLDEMRYERRRLVTYANWPIDTNIEPEALAQAGLFYLCRADRVKCAFCYGILRNWESSEEPMTKHSRLFPRCPFLRNPRAAGNVALDEEPTAEQILNVITNAPSRNSAGELGIQTAHPKHPSMVVEAVRLATFDSYPEGNHVSPDSLAHAGFYYTGDSDEVCCFFCDGHLDRWQAGEDPMTKHRHLYPHCGFVGLTQPADEPNAANATGEESGSNTGSSSSLTCTVCKTAARNIVFLPCGHLACCSNCAKSRLICPVCRCAVKGSVQAFLS